MDDRTTRILGALDGGGVDLLLALLGRAATEQELAGVVPFSRSTVHRRLEALADAGLIARAGGIKHSPNRPWEITHTAETDTLIQSLLDLADRAESASAAARQDSRALLNRSRASRSGLRAVPDPGT
jgi:DNA-binding IclR family transcriptional regulator